MTVSLAVWRGDRDAVRAYLERGANPDALDDLQRTPIWWAIVARDRPMTELLLAHAPATLAATTRNRIALREAAALDERWLVDALLAHGVSVDGAEDHRASPLLTAAANGAYAAMQSLIDRGASVSFVDPDGDTPLAAAVRAGCVECVDLLLAHHADLAHVDGAGQSPLDWAWRTDQPALAEHLITAGAPNVTRPPVPAPRDPTDAIARAIPLLQHANASWTADGECNACHHLPMAVRAVAIVDRLGFAVDHELATAAVTALRDDDHQFATQVAGVLDHPDALLRMSMEPAGDKAFVNAWFLAAEIDAGLPGGPDQRTLATLLARLQQRDGRWRAGPMRGVIESSDLEATAFAIHAIHGYGDAKAQAVVPAAARWLAHATPRTIVDHAARLRAVRDLGQDTSEEVATLRRLQHRDGSWAHTTGPGDAYSTGLVAVMLIEAGGVSPDDPAIGRAVTYLLTTQDADGSWLVPSRAAQLLEPTERGFPHGKLQFLSFASTAWATTAIAYATTHAR